MIGGRLLTLLYPFIKEMLLGDMDIKDAIVKQRKKVLFIALILGSIFLNVLFLPKLFSLSVEYVNLDKKYKETLPMVERNQFLEGFYAENTEKIKTLTARAETAESELSTLKSRDRSAFLPASTSETVKRPAGRKPGRSATRTREAENYDRYEHFQEAFGRIRERQPPAEYQ